MQTKKKELRKKGKKEKPTSTVNEMEVLCSGRIGRTQSVGRERDEGSGSRAGKENQVLVVRPVLEVMKMKELEQSE